MGDFGWRLVGVAAAMAFGALVSYRVTAASVTPSVTPAAQRSDCEVVRVYPASLYSEPL